MTNKKSINITYKKLTVEAKHASIVPVTKLTAMRVYHGSLSAVLGVVMSMSNDQEDKTAALVGALQSLSFDKVFALGSDLLKHAFVDDIEIEDLAETTAFDENPEELYILIALAIKENYPKTFAKISGFLKDVDLTKVLPK